MLDRPHIHQLRLQIRLAARDAQRPIIRHHRRPAQRRTPAEAARARQRKRRVCKQRPASPEREIVNRRRSRERQRSTGNRERIIPRHRERGHRLHSAAEHHRHRRAGIDRHVIHARRHEVVAPVVRARPIHRIAAAIPKNRRRSDARFQWFADCVAASASDATACAANKRVGGVFHRVTPY